MFCFVGIEGVGSTVWHSLGSNLKLPAKVLQLMKSREETTLDAVANSVIQDVYDSFGNQKEFFIVGHSFGTLIAVKIASLLEKRGRVGHIVLIDGSPAYLKRLAQGLVKSANVENYTDILFMTIFVHLCRSEFQDTFTETLAKCTDIQEKINLVIGALSEKIKATYSIEYLKKIITAILNRLKVVVSLNVEGDEINTVMDKKLKSEITLIRPTQVSFADIAEDYDLHKYTEKDVTIKYVDGNHLTVLENNELANLINNITTSNQS